jgi:flagellar assembly protein FliH
MQPAKFTFDTEFTAARDVASEAARGRQRKTYMQSEIEAMVAQARGEGFEAGEVRALEAVASGAREAAIAIRQAMADAHTEVEALRAEAAGIALACARKLAAVAVESLPMGDVEAMLREAMHQAVSEPRIVLRASEKVVDALKEYVNDIAHQEGFEGRVMLFADAAQKGADCRIEWRGGGVERKVEAIERSIAELIERRFSHTPSPLPEK